MCISRLRYCNLSVIALVVSFIHFLVPLLFHVAYSSPTQPHSLLTSLFHSSLPLYFHPCSLPTSLSFVHSPYLPPHSVPPLFIPPHSILTIYPFYLFPSLPPSILPSLHFSFPFSLRYLQPELCRYPTIHRPSLPLSISPFLSPLYSFLHLLLPSLSSSPLFFDGSPFILHSSDHPIKYICYPPSKY